MKGDPAMNPRSIAFLFASLTASAIAGDSYWVFFGTYTSGKSPSKGIYRAKFNSGTGELGKPELAAEAGSPSFLAISPSKQTLYSVGEASGEGSKAVSAYKLALPGGELTKLNAVSAVGQGPCHVNTDRTGQMLGIANYGSGSVASYKVAADGSLSESVSFVQHEGSSVNPKRQTGPHAHSINFSPDNRYAYVCDLGMDQIQIYKVDPATGALTVNDPAFAKTPVGGGPRHLAFHPNGKFVFVNNEISLTETVFGYDEQTGALTAVETVSTLPEGEAVRDGLSTAETVVHPNGKFVYVSNRGHDTIAVFSFDAEKGKLTLIQNAPAEGEVPRNFNLDPTGKWMIVAHQKSNSVAVLKVDEATGKLSFTGTKHEVGAPVCVRFVGLD
jgi:6-phosphogluconolactonase